MPTVTTTTETAVKLSPSLKRKLLGALRLYADEKQKRDAADDAMRQARETIETLFVDADAYDALLAGADVEGFKTKLVTPARTSINKKKLVALGINLAEVTDTRPGKAYVKVTVPGESEDDA